MPPRERINIMESSTFKPRHLTIYKLESKQEVKSTWDYGCSRWQVGIWAFNFTDKKIASKNYRGASLLAQMVQNLPAMPETQVRSLDWGLPLEKGMATCCQVASVVSDSVWPHGLQPTRLLHPWDSPGKNTGVGWKEWQPTPIFLPGELHGQRSLVS